MLTDQPITSAKDDLLGRAPFAWQVASAMLASPFDPNGSFSIGLIGGWGSGKTSVINMVVEMLMQHAGGKKAPIVIQFNPWQYPSDDLLPEQLLKTIAAELKKPSRSERLNKAGKAMDKYRKALAACSQDGKVETVAQLRGKALQPQDEDSPSVMERKEKVKKHLRKQDQNIYVIMDDIDRLSSRRVRHALQLCNAIAGFPHMVYLLSFDQEVVASALSKELDGNGWEYLKKFIQVQFAMPAPESGRIRDILSEYFNAWLSTQQDLNYEHAYFEEISPYIFRCVASIRDVYRFINTFRYQYQALGNEVNFVDLLAVTALQLYNPQALPWMQDHRDDLLRGGGLAYHSADAAQQRKLMQSHLQMLTELGDGDPKTLVPLIGHMFPRYGRNVLDVKGEEFDARYVRMRRICCEEFFDMYFTQSTESLAITQKEIMETVQDMDAHELRRYLDGLTQEERRNAYISHLPHYLQDIREEKLPVFFAEVLRFSRLPEGKTPKDKPFQRSFFHECCYCALRILSQMDDGMKTRSLSEAVNNANKDTIPILVTLLQRILAHNPDADSIVVNEIALSTYLKQMLNKIHAIALESGWLTAPNPVPVLEYWKQADSVSFGVYLKNLLEDDGNAARLISSLVRRFDQGLNMEYQFGDINGTHAFSDVFPRTAAKAAVNRLRGTDAFRALPEDVQMDCVAFSLMDDAQSRATQQDVLEAYPEWLKERQAQLLDDNDDEENDFE